MKKLLASLAIVIAAALPAVAQAQSTQPQTMRKFIIERDIPKVGSLDQTQIKGAATKSNQALGQLGPDIQWVHSYVAGDKTFCLYLAKDEAVIKRHAEISGFPASKITEIKRTIDPTTASE